MMQSNLRKVMVGTIAVLVLVASAADARDKKKKVPPPPPPAPPPPAYVYVDWKPVPPEWASPNLAYKPLGPDGLRISVNRNISPAQTLWNLRSGYNVAALNCRNPKHADIVVNYRAFLKAHAKTLKATNTRVDAEFRARHGAGFVRHREKFMTEVYNHFAVPPVQPAFCDAALAMSNDAKKVKSANLSAFATTALPSLEIVFDDFYKRYDQYKLEMAAWEAKWGKDAVPGSRVLASAVPINGPAVAAPM
jgi:hypothetical protein